MSRTFTGGGARVVADGGDLFMHDAALALSIQAGCSVEPHLVTPHVDRMTRAPLSFFARHCLNHYGVAVDQWAAPETIFEAALAMDGPERVHMDGAGPVNRPGSFPNLLSNLANKILDEGLGQADVTYPIYTGLLPKEIPDFKPAPIVARGMVGQLDEVLDGEATKEAQLAEELLSMLVVSRFGNKVGLTPVLLANDDVGAFAENLLGLAEAYELTLNRLCLYLLVGNVPLLDGFNLFDDTNHGNAIDAAGDGPSDTEWQAMNLKVAAQQTVGDTAYVRARLAVALVPTTWERQAQQAFLPFRDIGENKQPATDSNLNVYRGRVTIAVEPELQELGNKVWYGFCDPRRVGQAAIVRAYFRGYGRGGRRERWYDPNTKTTWFNLEGRFGAAAKQYRTVVRNKGEA